MFRKITLVVAASAALLTITACNTVKGAGKDLQSASDSTKDAINK